MIKEQIKQHKGAENNQRKTCTSLVLNPSQSEYYKKYIDLRQENFISKKKKTKQTKSPTANH